MHALKLENTKTETPDYVLVTVGCCGRACVSKRHALIVRRDLVATYRGASLDHCPDEPITANDGARL